jgi:RsiW-degrading membrane proteinase PrsW (M82 family)
VQKMKARIGSVARAMPLLRLLACSVTAHVLPTPAWCQTGARDAGNPLVGLVGLALLLLLYFLPYVIARLCHRRQRVAILVLNFFLGWTVLGWIGALIWACIEDRPEGKA